MKPLVQCPLLMTPEGGVSWAVHDGFVKREISPETNKQTNKQTNKLMIFLLLCDSSGDGLSNPELVDILTKSSKEAVEFLSSFGLVLSEISQGGGHSVFPSCLSPGLSHPFESWGGSISHRNQEPTASLQPLMENPRLLAGISSKPSLPTSRTTRRKSSTR